MLNVMGGARIYEVDDIDRMLGELSSFVIVDVLPNVNVADDKTVYYKKSSSNVNEITGYRNPLNPSDISPAMDSTHDIPVYQERPALVPYVVGKNPDNNTRAWYTCGADEKAPLSDRQIIELWNNVEIGG